MLWDPTFLQSSRRSLSQIKQNAVIDKQWAKEVASLEWLKGGFGATK